jgi:hypothetical protein
MEAAMQTLVTLRQSPTLSRALIAEARAARRGTLVDRLRAALARRHASAQAEFDAIANLEPR